MDHNEFTWVQRHQIIIVDKTKKLVFSRKLDKKEINLKSVDEAEPRVFDFWSRKGFHPSDGHADNKIEFSRQKLWSTSKVFLLFLFEEWVLREEYEKPNV